MKAKNILSLLLTIAIFIGMTSAFNIAASAEQREPQTLTASTPAELKSAFEEAFDGDTVKLTADILNYDEYYYAIDSMDYCYTVTNKKITLDIGTYNLYGGAYDDVNEELTNPLTLNNATVTLIGTTGTLTNYEIGTAAVTLKNGSVLNVNGGNVIGGNSGDAFLLYKGTVNINDGTVQGNYIDVIPYGGSFESGVINVYGGKIALYNGDVISSAGNSTDFTFYAGFCNVNPKTTQLATGSTVKDLGSSEYYRYQVQKTDSVTKVKVEWEITEVTATRKDAKKWDPDTLSWDDDDANDEITVSQNGAAVFTLTNHSSVKIDAAVEFAAATGFSPAVKFNEGINTAGTDDGKITLDTASGSETYTEENPPTGKITVTVTADEEDFKSAAAATSAKYGTYTVTIRQAKELVTLTFVASNSKSTISYNGTNYSDGQSFNFTVPKNSVISIVSTGSVGEGPTQSTLTVDGKTVTQYSEIGSTLAWFPISNGEVVTENTTIRTAACILSGNQVTLADGSTKLIDDVTTEDELMTFNFYEGKPDGNYPMYIMKHENTVANVITVTLDNGTTLEMCDWQQFFDMDKKTYFDIDTVNYQKAIGKNVLFIEKGEITTAKIINTTMQIRTCTSYEIFTEYNKNFVANGILTVEPETYLQGVYTIGDDMKIDMEKYQKDVDTYGRYTYEEFADIMTKEEFDKMNVADKKIAVGKGIVSEKWLFALYKEWTPLYR